MHTPLSIIFFTVFSGAGLGISFLLGIFSSELTDNAITVCTVLSLLFVFTGLISSTLHLANPKNAWRSFMRVRTSWLSREAVAVAIYVPIIILWFFNRESIFLGILLSIISIITVYCTAMIYQSLKPIPQWHHPLTSITYISFSLLTGCLWCIVSNEIYEKNLIYALQSFLSIVLVLLSKIFYYRRLYRLTETTTAHAIGFSQAQARLLDAGHIGPTFLTKEFNQSENPAKLHWLRVISTVLFIVCPIIIVLDIFNWGIDMALLVVTMMAILIERWLFFKEAKHTIRAFH